MRPEELEQMIEDLRNGRQEVDVDTLTRELLEKHKKVVRRPNLIAALKRLEEAGVGRFIVGRRGRPSRFRWNEEPQAAAGHVGRRDERSPAPVCLVRHRFVLRPNLTVEFDLPEDLNRAEARRLAQFIETLPFETD